MTGISRQPAGYEIAREKSGFCGSRVWILSWPGCSIERMFAGEMLESLGPVGPEAGVARILAGVDRYSLSGHDRIELLKARARLRAHVDAELLADMVSVLDAETRALSPGLAVDQIHEVTAAEIQAALCWTRRMAERQLDFAATLVSDYPQVEEMLHAGLIDLARARVIVDQTCHLDPR